MKKLIITTAVMLMAALGANEANAELTLLTTNSGRFDFDGNNDGTGDNLIVGPLGNQDDGLNDLAIYVGYQPTFGPALQASDFVLLTGGTATGGVDANLIPRDANIPQNEGTFTFTPGVDVGNGVTVDASVFYRLTDTTNGTPTGTSSSNLLYELSLETNGVEGGVQGSLLSFVGYDFNATGATATTFTAADGTVINTGDPLVGFGGNPSNAELANNDRSRVLNFDGNFTAGTGNSQPDGVSTSNTLFDTFLSPIGDDLLSRFDDTSDVASASSTSLGLGAFSNFNDREGDQTDTTAGAFGFNSVRPSNIPEPSALIMASMGLGMVAFRRRRKQQA